MKKLLTLLAVAVMAVASVLAVACGGNELNYTASEDQLAALTEVKAGTSDIAVIDRVMAKYYLTSTSNFKTLQILEGQAFTFPEEVYAIGFRKIDGDTSMKEWIDYALYLLQEDGTIETTASTYGLNDVLKTIPAKEQPELIEGTDFYNKVIEDKTFTIGITVFDPMAIRSDDPGTNGYKGFDCELARWVVEKLNEVLELNGNNALKYAPQIITWSEKENELNAGNIDAIWNGFTATEERAEKVCFSEAYMINRQVIVIRKDDAAKYTDYASMKKAKFVAEGSSAGEEVIKITINNEIFPAA